MAGQPKKQAIIRVLTERARVELDDDAGPLDYVVQWCENGKTLQQLAEDLTKALGFEVFRARLHTLMREMYPDTAEARLTEARRAGARAIAEESVSIIDDADDSSREKLQHAKMRADVRQWIAGKWNRDEFGESKGTSISISLHGAHLDSLHLVPNATARIANPQVETVVEAEVIDSPRLESGSASSGDSEVSPS